MARIVLQADWRAFSSGNAADIEVVSRDLAEDKKEALKQARAALDAAEKLLEDKPELAQATAPVARAAQANTKVAPLPAPEKRSDGVRRSK